MLVERRIERVSSTKLVIDLPLSFVDRSVEVLVLTLDDCEDPAATGSVAPNGRRFASLARELTLGGLGGKFGDPLVWQAQTRTDRPLLGRE